MQQTNVRAHEIAWSGTGGSGATMVAGIGGTSGSERRPLAGTWRELGRNPAGSIKYTPTRS